MRWFTLKGKNFPMMQAFCVIAGLGLFSHSATAAEFSIKRSTKQIEYGVATEVLMKGAIVEGDKDKLAQIIETVSWELNRNHLRLRMNSDGGSLSAGIALGEYIYAASIQTYVGSRETCLSACAIAFMFGVQPDGDDHKEIDRTIHHTAELGFHAPYAFAKNIKVPDKVREALLPKAELGARQAGSDLVRLNVSGRLPSDLIQELLVVEQEDFLFVDTVDRAGRWNISIDNSKPLHALHHKRLEAYCTNVFAWESSVAFKDRGDRYDVGLLSLQDGNALGTAMMEIDCDLSLQNASSSNHPAVVERNRGIVKAWKALPADVPLRTLGPEEVDGGSGPVWSHRFPIVNIDGSVDYNAIKNVSGRCEDGRVWVGGWYGREGSNEYKNLLYSHATVASCGGGFGPMSIKCEPANNKIELRFAYGPSQTPNRDGRVVLSIDGVTYTFKGRNGNIYGHEQIYVDLPKLHPVLEALKSGNSLKLVGDGPNQTIHLGGSRKAIEAMELSCG